MNQIYEVQATAIGGRSGAVATADGRYRYELAQPTETGTAPDGASPEQFLAAGYAACLLSAIRSVADERAIQISIDANVTVRVGLVRAEADRAALDFDLAIGVDLPDVAPESVEDLVAMAHARCPFSRALRGAAPIRTTSA